MNEKLIDKIAKDMENPLPTPPVGFMVNWYPHGIIDDTNRVAAIVTAIEGPGKVTLTMLPPSGMPTHKKGVHFKDHPAVERQKEHVRVHNGIWGYLEFATPLKTHLQYHVNELKRRKESVMKSERVQREAAENRAEKTPVTA